MSPLPTAYMPELAHCNQDSAVNHCPAFLKQHLTNWSQTDWKITLVRTVLRETIFDACVCVYIYIYLIFFIWPMCHQLTRRGSFLWSILLHNYPQVGLSHAVHLHGLSMVSTDCDKLVVPLLKWKLHFQADCFALKLVTESCIAVYMTAWQFVLSLLRTTGNGEKYTIK